MKKHKKTITVIIILIVALLMFASFFGVKIKKNENGERVNIIPDLKLGMEFGTTRVITGTVDDTVNETIRDAEGNIVEREEGVEYTEEAGYTIEQTKVNVDSDRKLENYKKEKEAIEERLNNSGVAQYFIDMDKQTGKIIIEIPEDDKADDIQNLIKSSGSLLLIDGETYETVFDNSTLKKADVVMSQGDVQTGVFLQLEFNEEGTNKLKELSEIYKSTTETKENENGEEEEVTNSKVVWVLLNGTFLGSTEISNIMYNDKLMFTYGVSNDANELQTAIKNAQDEAILLNAKKSPLVYSFENEQRETIIDTNIMFIYAVGIISVFLIVYIYLIIKFKAKGFISIYFQVGFLGILLLVLRLTNVILTMEGIAGIIISMVLEVIFTFIVLESINKKEDGMYKKSNLSFFLTTLPIYIISIVYTFATRAHINSFGMSLFWGIIIIYIYNFIFSKFVFENLSTEVGK